MYSVLFFMVIHYLCVIWPNYCFCPVYHTVWNFNLANNFSTVSARSSDISHTGKYFYLWQNLSMGTMWPWPQSLAFFLKTLVLHVYNYSTASARELIFHLSIPFDNFDDFPWVPTFFTLGPWPLNLTYFSKLKPC